MNLRDIYNDSIGINDLFEQSLLKDANELELLGSRDEMFVRISYSKEYRKLLGILTVLINMKEFSSRTCWIVTRLLEMNSSHYCLWILRTTYFIDDIILNNVDMECEWLKELTFENPKCYQIWQYRQTFTKNILSKADKDQYHAYYMKEIKKIEELLGYEPKNYHCWSYRSWFVEALYSDRIMEKELSMIHHFIKLDPWNNSAWSYRYGLVMRNNSDKIVESAQYELYYLLQHLNIDNESVWNYSRGWLKYLSLEQKKEWFESVEQICTSSLLKSNRFYLMLKLNMLKESLDALDINQILDTLYKIDPIRKNYWDYICIRDQYILNK